MFDRKKYKSFALKMLKGRWSVPVLMTLIISLVSALFFIPQMIQMINTPEWMDLVSQNYSTTEELLDICTGLENTKGSDILSFISSLVSYIFVMASLSVYLKITRSPEKVYFSTFIEGFNNWVRAVLGFIWQFIWIIIWSLLLVIPGIIKAISYSQMIFILNEFENVSVTKAMRISMIITKGHLGDLFLMGLSFIGWDMLAVLTLGIGTLWLNPYKYTTYMNAFHALLKEALETGKIKPEDLQ